MLIGLTGGIGSGKSTLARLLAQRGALVVDADKLGHTVLARPEVVAALVGAFGPGVLDTEGRISRPELGRLAFADPEAYARLGAVVRPILEALLWDEVASALGNAKGEPVVVDAALLYEWGVAHRFDAVVVVVAPEEERCRRAAARQGVAAAEVRRRMQFQLPPAEKAARADLVVDNGGSLADLEAAAGEVWRFIEGQNTRGREG